MNISEKIERSKIDNEGKPALLSCENMEEKLAPVRTSDNIEVLPIWQYPVDEIEGPLYAEYIHDHPEYSEVLVRQEVLERLTTAAAALPSHLKLVVRAGHRPLEVQKKLLASLKQSFKEKNPQATDSEALAFARIYVSDPDIKLPPHCCGAAVDVDLVERETDALIDFGCPVNTDSEIAFLHSDLITPRQAANRMILLKAMLEAGFASLYSEWWHFSYGDQQWAWFYNHPQSVYGITDSNL